MTTRIVWVVAYLVLAPVIGCLMTGVKRKTTAKIHGDSGPPIIQPYWDVRKLLEKEYLSPTSSQDFYIAAHLLFTAGAGAVFFAGGHMMLAVLMEITGAVFLTITAYSSGSPYSVLGARRHMTMLLATQPMMIITALGFFIYKDTFMVREIARTSGRAVLPMIALFLCFIYIMTIKSGKAPFDTFSSTGTRHELVGGISTEISGPALAFTKLAQWYENIFLFGIILLFFCNGRVVGYIIGIAVCILIYFLQIIAAGYIARMKWEFVLRSSWVLTVALGIVNLFVLNFIIKGV